MSPQIRILSVPTVVLFALVVGVNLVVSMGDGTDTISLTDSETETQTITPYPTSTKTRTGSLTATRTVDISDSNTLVATETFTDTQTTLPCTVAFSVVPLETVSYPFTSVIGAPEQVLGEDVSIFSIRAVEFAREGLYVEVRMQNAIFNVTEPIPKMVKIFAKDRLVAPFFGAPEHFPPGGENDYDSQERHGLLDETQKGRLTLTYYRTGLSSIGIRFNVQESYRLGQDEYIYITPWANATVPGGCGTPSLDAPAVIRVRAFQYSNIYTGTQVTCFLTIMMGIIASFAGTSITTSHQAGMIAIVAAQHFAQEDGAPMGLGVHPTQFRIGQDKYRYVLGGIFGDVALILGLLLIQRVAIIVYRVKGYSPEETFRIVRYPRITVTVLVHLTPSLMFLCGRNFGNQSTVMFVLSTVTFCSVLVALAWGFRMHISTSARFKAKWMPYAYCLDDPLREVPIRLHEKKRHLTILKNKNLFEALMSAYRGSWVSTDTMKSFVITDGFVFENYIERSKFWMGIEMIDIFICCLLSVFDNYTTLLALYQFLITLLVKVVVVIAMILLRPCSNRHSGKLLLVIYLGMIVGELALFIGSMRIQLIDLCVTVQDISCFLSALAALCDCGLTGARSIIAWRELLRRKRDFQVEQTHDYRVPLEQGYLKDSRETPLLALPIPEELQPVASGNEIGSEGTSERVVVSNDSVTMGEMLAALPGDHLSRGGIPQEGIVRSSADEEVRSESSESSVDSAFDEDGRPIMTHPRHREPDYLAMAQETSEQDEWSRADSLSLSRQTSSFHTEGPVVAGREWHTIRTLNRPQFWADVAQAVSPVRVTHPLCEEDYVVL
jgi:hypothetical protein